MGDVETIQKLLFEIGTDTKGLDAGSAHTKKQLKGLLSAGRTFSLMFKGFIASAAVKGVYELAEGTAHAEEAWNKFSNVAVSKGYDAVKIFNRIEKAAELRIVIEDKITNNQLEGIDKMYLQLTDLGFECVSLALKARQAAGQKNIADEFNARHQLASILPQDDLKALPYWRSMMS